MTGARFLYDFNSPYAYLASTRVERLLGEDASWEPISLAFVLRAAGRRPWSMTDRREPGMRECEGRAREYGLPPLRWTEGWPVETYSLLPLRAAYVAEEHGRLREFTHAAFRTFFAEGTPLTEPDVVARIGAEVGVPEDAVREGVERDEIKQRVRAATDAALAAGVAGVPTTLVGEQIFWGDDRLEEAAAALSA